MRALVALLFLAAPAGALRLRRGITDSEEAERGHVAPEHRRDTKALVATANRKGVASIALAPERGAGQVVARDGAGPCGKSRRRSLDARRDVQLLSAALAHIDAQAPRSSPSRPRARGPSRSPGGSSRSAAG